MKKRILCCILIFQVSYLLANDSIKYSISLKMGPAIVPQNSELEKGKYGFNAGYCFGRHFNNVLLITTINYSSCTLIEPDWFQDKYTEDVVNADLMIGYKYQESKVLIQFSAGVSYLFGNKHGKYIPPHGLFGSRGYENIRFSGYGWPIDFSMAYFIRDKVLLGLGYYLNTNKNYTYHSPYLIFTVNL